MVKVMCTHLFSPSVQACDEIAVDEANLSDAWVEEIWRYIARHFPFDLTPLHGLHLLPTGDGKLSKFRKHSAVIVLNSNVSSLPDCVQKVCRAVGVRVVNSMPAPICSHKSVWGEYILQPDARGVMIALTWLDSGQVVSRFQPVSDEEKKDFLEYVANASRNDPRVLQHGSSVLRTIPMFQTVDGSGFQPSSFVSLNEVTTAAPTESIPVSYPNLLLDASMPNVQYLMSKLNVKILSLRDALVSLIFPAISSSRYSQQQVTDVMQFICDRWKEFQTSRSFLIHMKKVKFIARCGGDLASPCELFNPHDSRLVAMFRGEDVFPVGVFGESSYRHVLEQLGLKGQESVTATDVWHIVSRLDATTCSDPHAVSACIQSATEFLNFLEQHYSLLYSYVPSSNDRLLNLLNRVRWVPVMKCRPDRYPSLLPFHGENYDGLLARPSDVLSPKHCFLVGSVKHCLHLPVCNISSLANKFSWTEEPNIDDVIQHLLKVIAVSSDMENIDLDLECIVKEIYAHLNRHSQQLSQFLDQLNDVAWIIHGSGFARVDQVVKRKSFMDLQPYVYVLPPAFQGFEDLWKTVGLTENCNLVVVLKNIASCHEGGKFSQDEAKRDLQYVVNILNEIVGSADLEEYRDDLLIPVETCDGRLQLEPIDDCTYCDKEWYQQDSGVCHVDSDVYLVNRLVPTSTAEALNIHSIVSRMLKAEELHIGLTSYGQQPEPLTKRLRSILNDYTDGLAVIKELIQNADDAGATEVRLLYDARQNTDALTKLLDPAMKDLQGPALWVYNDATFTTEDFENLVKISGGTKEQCRDKIGRFGLGFNAVYNLTDLPALVSRNYVVYLDPHTKYLNKAIRDKSKPGIKLDLDAGRRSLQYFSDQFKPFTGIFGCSLNISAASVDYPATLFRFPLRTQEQSASSEICNRHYSHEEMKSLLSMLLKSADHLLLFTQNVRTVSISCLGADCQPENTKELYCITKNVGNVLRSPPVDDQRNQCAFVQMANSLLEAKTANTVKLESSLILRITVDVSANAGVLLNTSNAESRETHWLVSSSMGQHESLSMSSTRPDLVSVAGVAAQLQKNGDQFTPMSVQGCGDNDKGGIIFCFLPLPFTKTTDLPVHVNGFFAVTSSRMHLVEKMKGDKTDERAVWNELLLKDAVKLAYENLLQDVLQLCETSDSLLIWPMHKPPAEAGILSCLTDSLYADLCKEDGPKVCRINDRYVSLGHCQMLEADFRQSEVGDAALQVLTMLAETADFQVNMIDLPIHLLQSMLQSSAGQTLRRLQISKHEFYVQWLLPNIYRIDSELRDQLVLAALFDSDLCSLLKSFECIPSLPNGQLRKPSDLIHPLSSLAVLYDEDEERFPCIENHRHGKYQSNDIYAKLKDIGMKHDDLSWQELSDRCAKVPQNHEISGERLSTVIHLMSDKAKHITASDMEHIDRIRKQRFFPVRLKPDDFPLPWKGDEHGKFTSCEEAYLSGVQNLVSSSYPIIDDYEIFRYEHTQLKKVLKLAEKPVDMSTIVHQLNCAECHVSDTSEHNTNVTNVKKLHEICEDVYCFLGKQIKSTEYAQNLKEELRQKKCVFVLGKGVFMRPSDCAKKVPVAPEALLPYLYGVPTTVYSAHGALLKTIGVKQSFEAEDYIRILQHVRDTYLDDPVQNDDLKVALDIINSCLTDSVPEDVPIYVPNANGIMCAADTLCFNNYTDNQLIALDIELCHPKIPCTAARKLRIKTIEQEYLRQNSIGIPFGQKEKLVTRIRKILTAYPFGKDILKEMLQNADDAGATELHFINDERRLPSERVFSDSWKDLQGPALCVYNDKPFTEKDIDGIQNFGEGSKSDDPTKTGQYGVGFNSVYHITDVPSIFTYVDNEQVLCVFDPNCQYVPGATNETPGRRINSISSLQTQFPDVFCGYNVGQHQEEQCSLFRLPLRNYTVARKSEISQKSVTSTDIANLFKEFKSEMCTSLLFLNSVKRISLRHVDVKTGLPTTTYSVTAELSPEAEETRERFHKLVKETARKLRDGECSLQDVEVQEVTYPLTVEDSDGNSDEWVIVQRLGFESPDQVPDIVKSAHIRNDLALLPRAGVAYHTKSNRTHSARISSQLFCFLPLPVHIKFPVSINGHFVLDYENRRHLWKSEEADYKTMWNTCLMEKVIAPAYCTLLDFVRPEMWTSQEHEKYFALFPSVTADDVSYVRRLSIAVYQRLQHMTVLPVCNIDAASENDKLLWIKSVKDGTIEGFFDNLDHWLQLPTNLLRKVSGKQKHEIVREVLNDCGFLLFMCPLHVHMNFRQAGIEVKVVSPEAVLEFFRSFHRLDSNCRVTEVNIPVTETPFKDVERVCTLLKYCTEAAEYKQLLKESPLLVTSDGRLRIFDASALKYEPLFADILPHIPDQFFHQDIFSVLQVSVTSCPHLCKKLSVEEFVAELANVLPPLVFHGVNKRVAFGELESVSVNGNAKVWIERVWTFLNSLVDKSPERMAAVMEPLAEWCLLPVSNNERRELLPIMCARCVLPFSGSSFAHILDQVLSKLGVLRPLRFTDITEVFDFYCTVLGSIEKLVSVLAALEEALDHGRCLTCRLTAYDGETLLTYFMKHMSVLQQTPNSMRTIQRLPVFCTVYSQLVSINGCCVYVLPEGIPVADMESWSSTNDVIFLKDNGKLTDLFAYLGCRHLTDIEVYCSFIFMHFEMLSDSGRYEHLQYVRDNMCPRLKEQSKSVEFSTLVGSLRQLKFIPKAVSAQCCELATASEFYDLNVELFHAMHQASDFVPKPYRDTHWNKFLRECGMIHDVSQDMFLQYANQVAVTSERDITKQIAEQSKALLKHLAQRRDLGDQLFLQKLRNIPFIVPYSVGRVKEDLYPQFGKRNSNGCLQLVAFEGSIGSYWSGAVWSVQSTIDESVFMLMPDTVNCDFLWSQLKFDQKPKLEYVAQHVQQLCSKLVSKLHEPSCREKIEILGGILKFVYGVLKRDDLPEAVVSVLSMSPCVIDVERRLLVRPQQVVLRMSDDEIEPYLISIPLDVGSYKDLFCKLGTSDSPTLDHFAMVLEIIHKESTAEEPHPNEMTAVQKAMRGFFASLQSAQKCACLTRKLYLLGRDKRLHESSALVMDDLTLEPPIADLGQVFLVTLEKCDIKISVDETCKLLKLLPAAVQPRFLSAAVTQLLDINLEVVECTLAQQLNAKLQSEEFRDAIIRLILHPVTELDPEKQQLAHDAAERLETIQVIGVKQITTYTTFNGERIPESACQHRFHVQTENSDGITYQKVYFCVLKQYDATFQNLFFGMLSEVIIDVVGDSLHRRSTIFIPQLLWCQLNTEHDLLDSRHIKKYTRDVKPQETYLPIPGSFVPIVHHHLLRRDIPLLKPGDYAALEKYDPAEYDEPGTPTYVVVKIIEQVNCDADDRPSDLRCYRVDVGHHQEEVVPAALLYAFVRQVTGAASCLDDWSEDTAFEDSHSVDYDDVVKYLKITLTDAWKMEQPDRNKILKRLICRWHPDNNTDNADLAARVTQFILFAADRLDHGLPLDDGDAAVGSPPQVPPTAGSTSSGGGATTSSVFCNSYYQYMSQRAQDHRRQQQVYEKNYAQNTSVSGERRKQQFLRSFMSGVNPQPGEGRRWFRQAEMDVQAAKNDEGGETIAYEWACYKYYQVSLHFVCSSQS